jgi:hypothetical protein
MNKGMQYACGGRVGTVKKPEILNNNNQPTFCVLV